LTRLRQASPVVLDFDTTDYNFSYYHASTREYSRY
jgi:hypothetical protein